MPDLTCSTCKTELMEHEAKSCLDEWVSRLLWPHGVVTPSPAFSIVPAWAWDLMDKVWELAPQSTIERYTITLWWQEPDGVCSTLIDGPTFPLRVCRAAIYLAARGKENRK